MPEAQLVCKFKNSPTSKAEAENDYKYYWLHACALRPVCDPTENLHLKAYAYLTRSTGNRGNKSFQCTKSIHGFMINSIAQYA